MLARMKRRDLWRKVLAAEMQRWSALSAEELLAKLGDIEVYEVTLDGKPYQVEVQLIENTSEYVHVDIGVDDGSLPASLRPESETFIRAKAQKGVT
jgi:hypothetical protein